MIMTTESPFTHPQVDMSHMRSVAGHALTLFDTVRRPYDLPRRARDLLEVGALLHDVGFPIDPLQHHLIGRDIVLDSDISGLDENERAIVACLVAFHRKKVRPDEEPAYVRLGKKDQHLALCLASLLRVADGLDYSHTQTTHIRTCEIRRQGVVLHLFGPHAEEDGARALKKADLWNKIFQHPVEVTTGAMAEPPAGEPAPDREEHRADVQTQPRLQSQTQADDADLNHWSLITERSSARTLAETGRRLLRTHFQELLTMEREVRKDTDIEGVHDMRVATRRLRAVLPAIKPVVSAQALRPFQKPIRKIARSLGEVRDCDVFLDLVRHYLEPLPAEQRPAMAPLVTALQRDRAAAYQHLLVVLDSTGYEIFKRDFARFLTDRAEGWNPRLRVCDVVGSIIWQRYEALRAYETAIDTDHNHSPIAPIAPAAPTDSAESANGVIYPDPDQANPARDDDDAALHEARIAGKHLRYVLEMLSAQHGELVDRLLAPIKALQSSLGSIQDIAVAKAYVATLETTKEEQEALDQYIRCREAERVHLLEESRQHWKELMSEGYRHALAELVVRL
ncbi:MAG: CHAD domain-containing protein [Chloroflexaceae bacterium]|nr:CHAD domain-containing protein [Chloroflexaceae bacterium]